MQNHKGAFLAAAMGFSLTVAVQLPLILEQRARVAEAAALAEASYSEPTKTLDEDATARFSQLLRRRS